MSIFLVAHGAWTGGWSWRKMHPLLRERGHTLLAPTFTGLGERAHLAHPGVDLDTHVADLLGVIETEDLRDLVLVGHSYGGMVATVVADRCPQRVSGVVYLDAFVPGDGDCLFDFLPDQSVRSMKQAASESGDGWRIPPNPLPPDTPAADAEWMLPRRRMQPLRTFEQRARIAGSTAFPRSYIYCTRSAPGDVFARFAQQARTQGGRRYHELDASHSPHVTAPLELAELLHGIVS
jgi:pimeloyl-ACP methyl ester carboxylesterase